AGRQRCCLLLSSVACFSHTTNFRFHSLAVVAVVNQEKGLRSRGGLDRTGFEMARGEVEVVLTLLFNLLLLVFLVKLLVAMFSTKLTVILLYLALLVFAMALSGRFPGGEFL
uniref:Uncharacterized protein n=1 Tax=Aegilops tauschii subsp. strangulata TaxID=200361 RepID=A0A453JEU9_AEGTS